MLTHDQAVGAYYDEANELLGILESALLELENDPHNAENIAEAFRALHTIKGPASMLGFEAIAGFTHELETFFDDIRSGRLLLDASLLALMLEAKDHIALLVEQGLAPAQEAVLASKQLLLKIQQYISAPAEEKAPLAAGPAARPADAASPPVKEAAEERPPGVYRIRFAPAPSSLLTGGNPLGLLEELQGLGVLYCAFYCDNIPSLLRFDTQSISGYWDIILNTRAELSAIQDVFIFVEDAGGIELEHLDTAVPGENAAKALLQELRAGHVPEKNEARVAKPEAPKGPPPQMEQTTPQTAQVPLQDEKTPEALPHHLHAATSSIRVDSARLDKLVNMVGEMVIIQSSLSQAAGGPLDPAVISRIAEDLERLTDEMRENALGLRMLPIGTIYSNFKRLVHDLSRSLGKEVELVTEGAETELDKTVIDRLKDPLVHILRNSLDHGIEDPHEREAAGKPRTGKIQLSSAHSGGDVVIRISDDGRGMNPEKIREKALQLGLLTPEAEPDEKELLELVLAPGFSTAKTVTDVSGRGVGMDVVKRSIDELRGRLTIESQPGEGSTLVIRLPLTLAIIDGFNVVVASETFIVPLASLRGFQERFVSADLSVVQSIERMGELIPCVSLRRLFEVPGDQPEYERIIICDVEGALIGLAVDNVIGRQQAVIKSLDDSLRRLKWISGTTINGDGSISLILDVPQLVRYASGLQN